MNDITLLVYCIIALGVVFFGMLDIMTKAKTKAKEEITKKEEFIEATKLGVIAIISASIPIALFIVLFL